MVSKSGCMGWLEKRTILEKALLSLSSILLLTLLIMILIGATYQGKKGNLQNDETSCWSEECKQTAEEILKSLDAETDACSNFYNYACGMYGLEPGQTLSVAGRSTESIYFSLKRLMESRQKFDIQGLDDLRSFYNTCVEFGSLEQELDKTRKTLLDVMTEMGVGTWPIVDSLYSFDDYIMERNLANLILLDVPVAFQMEVVPDQQITGSYLVKISPGGPREAGRTQDEIRNDAHLQMSVLTSFFLISAPSSKVFNDILDILTMDANFANITEQNKNTTCDVITLAPQEAASELKKLTSSEEYIDWDLILSEIRNKTGLVRPFAVELHCKQKIKNYLRYLNTFTERSLTNYLGWRMFSKFVEIVIPNFQKFQFETGVPFARWRVCLEHMEKFSSPIFADLLSREIVDTDVQKEVERISNATLSSAKLLVSRASWLTDVQKSRISDKVSRIRIRYPYKRHSGDAVQIAIPKAEVTNFTRVVIQRQREEVIQRFRRLDRRTESSGQSGSWEPLLTEIDNFASPGLTAYVYFDKIRTPYIRRQGSQWMNYGGFGMFIAREISKVLLSLNTGVGQEEKDLVWNLWYQNTASSTCLHQKVQIKAANYLKSSLSDMFSPRVKNKPPQNFFLDQSALEIAYEAAKLTAVSSSKLPGIHFSNEESFFVSYAQTNCEAEKTGQILVRERFNHTVQNYKSFKEVFSCESQFTCQIWA